MRPTEFISDLFQKGKALGGGAKPYFESGSHISGEITPQTEFARATGRALDIVDRRDGYARKLAHTFRAIAVICAVGDVVLAGGWIWEARQSHVQWFVNNVDTFGEPGEISEPVEWRPSDQELAERAKRVIKVAFSKYGNQYIDKENYELLRAVLYGNAIKQWSDWYEETKDAKIDARIIPDETIINKPTADPKTRDITWTEKDMVDNKVVATRRKNATITVEYLNIKKTREQYKKLRLPLYVTNILMTEVGKN